MIYIILATICSVLMLVIVRLFERYNVHTFYALMFNYASAFIFGIITKLVLLPHLTMYLSKSGWVLTIIEGILFITVFYWIAQTARYFGIAIASVSNKMSVVFPIIFASIFFNEQLGVIQWIGLFMALLSIYLVTYPNSTDNNVTIKTKNNSLIILPIMVFIGSGIVDSLINYGNKTIIDTPDKQLVFSTFVYAFAFLAGLVYLKLDKKRVLHQENFNWLNTAILGILLGIPNFFNLYFIIKSLNTALYPSGQVFLILNLSNITLTTIVGILLLKEKLNWQNWAGIILSILVILSM